MLYLFKGCGKCSGDLLQDGDEWRCFQCGSIYYPVRPPMELPLEPASVDRSSSTGETGPGRERPIIRRSARHLNPVLGTSTANDAHWWTKNKTVIHHLDQGKKVREIAEIVGTGPRQIRVVREQLRDLRTVEPELAGVV